MKYTSDYTQEIIKILSKHKNPVYRYIPKFIVHTILMYFVNNICYSILKNDYLYIRGYFLISPRIRPINKNKRFYSKTKPLIV